MLEIGVLDGKSLATWNEYYPHALIYGLDIDPTCVRFENERTKVFIGSQADVAVLADICNQVPEGFDVIIDDGSHYVRHVISSFGGLFGHLKPGGLYVIEDLSVARARDWGGTSFNRGMDLERHTGGNDPKEMVGFLKSVREREDVAELVLHLERICFIRKAEGTEDKSRLERGDQLESLLGKTLIQKIVSECRSLLRV